MKLIKNLQLPFGLIYSLRSVEIKRLKTYIKSNVANSFIKYSKFSIRAYIFLKKKPHKTF